MKVIITTSGTGSRLDKITKYNNKSLVKVGDKLAIDYIIDNYKKLDNVEFIITTGYYGDFVKQYIRIAYQDTIKYRFVDIDNYDKIGSSLLYSLSKTKEYIQEPFIFHCCDTIILGEMVDDLVDNILFVNDNRNSNQYATINKIDGEVVKINEKGEKVFDYAYIGLAYIKDYIFFWEKVDEILCNQKNNSSLSDIHVYKLMLKNNIKINYREVKNYYDIGNINSFESANKNIVKKYNVIDKLTESISFLDSKVIKFFYDKEKNRKYLERMRYIGVDIIPEIFMNTENYVSMELINSKPLSEISEYGIIYRLLEWTNKNLWNIDVDKEIDKNKFRDICYNFYYKKTEERVKLFLEKKSNVDFEVINKIKVKPIFELLKDINFDEICDSTPSRFHGDFILDNILIKDGKFVLIDWREDFGGSIEFGDKYYDLAKLKHNIYFNHKNILDNLFEINIINKNECTVDMKCNYLLVKQLNDFEKFVEKNNLEMRKINILQSLIWINMAPLYDNPLSNFLFNIGKFSLFLEINR